MKPLVGKARRSPEIVRRGANVSQTPGAGRSTASEPLQTGAAPTARKRIPTDTLLFPNVPDLPYCGTVAPAGPRASPDRPDLLTGQDGFGNNAQTQMPTVPSRNCTAGFIARWAGPAPARRLVPARTRGPAALPKSRGGALPHRLVHKVIGSTSR